MRSLHPFTRSIGQMPGRFTIQPDRTKKKGNKEETWKEIHPFGWAKATKPRFVLPGLATSTILQEPRFWQICHSHWTSIYHHQDVPPVLAVPGRQCLNCWPTGLPGYNLSGWSWMIVVHGPNGSLRVGTSSNGTREIDWWPVSVSSIIS